MIEKITLSSGQIRYGGSGMPRAFRAHILPLSVLTIAIVVGQIAMLIQRPLATTSFDTNSYLIASHLILDNLKYLAQPLRTPGFPTLLAIISLFATKAQFLASVVYVQAVICVITMYELYAVFALSTGKKWLSALAASLIALDIYVIAWERIVYTELLSFFSVVTLFLGFTLLVRSGKLRFVILLGLLGFLVIMVRPAVLLLPVVLGALLVFSGWRNRLLGRAVLHTAISLAITYGLLLAYMGLNLHTNQFFGLTYDHNITFYGKVEEFDMQGLSVSPQYAQIQQDTLAFDAYMTQKYPLNVPDPWALSSYYPQKQYWRDGYSLMGKYAEDLILRHPTPFLLGCLHDILQAWQAQPLVYSVFGASPSGAIQADNTLLPGISAYYVFNYGYISTTWEPWWINMLLIYSTLIQYAYELLPFLLVAALIGMWRKRASMYWLMMATLLISVLSMVFMAGVGNYAEFYRVRFPLDWAMIGAAVFLIADAVSWLKRKVPGRPYAYLPVTGSSAAVSTRSDASTNVPVRVDAPLAERAYFERTSMDNLLPDTAKRPTVVSHAGNITLSDLAHEQYYSPAGGRSVNNPEISIVLPCLNEEEAIGGCIDTLQHIISSQRLSAEIVVVDNASTDRSAEIAHAHGARVVYQPVRGYGNAYLKGFAEARGTYIVMADADNTYDLSEVNDFVEPLREGYDLVMGNRFAGRMAKGAMTFSHRYIGNPILSGIVRVLFHTTVRDSHCGMRAFTRAAYPRMRLRTGGMEFASEMVINAAKARLKIAERPISYAPRIGESKLHTVRDGWRHLRFMLLYSPTHLFLLPGLLLLLLGLGIEGVLTPGPLPLFGHSWDVHTMLLASVIALLGVQIMMLGLFARFFSLTEELDGEQDRVLQFINRAFTLERGLMIGGLIFALGFAADAFVLGSWVANGMGQLSLIRPTVLGSTGIAIGAEIVFGSFFLSFLQFRKTLHDPDAPLEDAASVRISAPAAGPRQNTR